MEKIGLIEKGQDPAGHGGASGRYDALKDRAFEVLASDEAKKVAKERSIEDPQKADACVKCHVTAFGVPDAEIIGFDPSKNNSKGLA